VGDEVERVAKLVLDFDLLRLLLSCPIGLIEHGSDVTGRAATCFLLLAFTSRCTGKGPRRVFVLFFPGQSQVHRG